MNQQTIDQYAREQYELWLHKLDPKGPEHEELMEIGEDDAEITDRFYKDMAFGTAGLRGVYGVGANRMNPRTVGRAAQGLANFISREESYKEQGVAIAYDCRYHSDELARLSAEILTANGIKVYLFPAIRSTPELSFTITYVGAVSGINLTASHNPKEYNGYKVYWNDGAQISGEISDAISEEMEHLSLFDEPKRLSLKEAEGKGLLVWLGKEIDEAYRDYVLGMSCHDKEELDTDISIVYTPLNGAGAAPMKEIADIRGFTKFFIVPEQTEPDPEFATVGYPNPEDPKGFERAEKWGIKQQAEVLIATDPDADRMAVELLQPDGTYHALNGNQTGALLIYYMAEALRDGSKNLVVNKEAENKVKAEEKGDGGSADVSSSFMMVKSIVTGNMGKVICEDHGIEVFEDLTGFKNLCGKAQKCIARGYTYFFAYEESIGCAPGEQVRDKDGICATMLLAEMAAYYKKKGQTLAEVLEGLYQKYGYFRESQKSLVLNGAEGSARIRRMMETIRKESPKEFGGLSVKIITDYIEGQSDIPASDVLKFEMEDGSWFAMRPSGTEPKIKFYFYTVSESAEISEKRLETLQQAVMNRVEIIK